MKLNHLSVGSHRANISRRTEASAVIPKANLRFLVLTGAMLLAAGAAIPARAQDSEDLKRGVARVSLMEGEVSVRRGDSGEWVAAVINAPLLTDDRIASGQNSRAEVQFDSANILRIGGNAEIHLAALENGRYQLEIARGTVTFRVLRPSTASVELNTPSVSVRPAREGTFRISVSDAGETEVTARAGDVEVFTPKGSQWVYAGQTMMARGTAADPEFQMVSAIPADGWDSWNDSRDHTLLQASNSYQYVPQGVYGAEDLDTAGSWTYIAPYGYCWRPTVVAAGWAPYREGRWVWEAWYGWTWVSYDPWGWAPYHYGRWLFDGRLGWNWYPGVLGVRHYWSPALVGFFGYGGGVGIGFGFGNIGWVPLAPYETFRPWWGRAYAGGFNRGINITSVSITNTYRNARVINGISGMRSEDFSAGRFGNVQRVNSGQVQQAGLVNGRMPINPSSANRRFSDRTVNIPRTSGNTQFFSRQGIGGQGIGTPAGATRPAGSAQGQSAYRRFGEPAGSANQNTRPGQAGSAINQRQGSLQRFGEPGSSQSAPRNDRPSGQNGNGTWKSFGTPGSSTPAARQPYNPPPQNRQAPSSPQGGRNYSPAPSNNAPRSTPSYSAPRSAPPSGAHSSGGGKGHR
jgi:FecR protein